mmetsp:Transcript_34272/g.53541  ORF Transcript_34272/g.53541 Transcript_34272/m.53541 type:complete len:139 (-) Transcript_34272:39-455(-)
MESSEECVSQTSEDSAQDHPTEPVADEEPGKPSVLQSNEDYASRRARLAKEKMNLMLLNAKNFLSDCERKRDIRREANVHLLNSSVDPALLEQDEILKGKHVFTRVDSLLSRLPNGNEVKDTQSLIRERIQRDSMKTP